MKTTTDNVEFNPDWASPPGDTIIDILNERNISIELFAIKVDMSLDKTHELLKGDTLITLGLAQKLAATLGATTEFWMLRDYQYWSTKEILLDQNISLEPIQKRMNI